MINEIKQNLNVFRRLIDDAFKKVDKRKRGCINAAELKKLMNLFGQFPTDNELRDLIIPRITNGKSQSMIRYKDFERYMLEPLLRTEINMEDSNLLLKAFQTLDTHKRKYIPVSEFKMILYDNGMLWNQEDYKQFIRNGDSQTKGVLMYEEYIDFIIRENRNNLAVLIS